MLRYILALFINFELYTDCADKVKDGKLCTWYKESDLCKLVIAKRNCAKSCGYCNAGMLYIFNLI